MSDPDPNWEYTDQSGHVHRWDADFNLPTLEPVSASYEEDGEIYHYIDHYVCHDCREEIEPGRKEGEIKHIPGLQRTEFTLSCPPQSPQETVITEAIFSGEKVRLKMPLGLDDQGGYITSLAKTPLALEVTIKGAPL
jgi:hypothetical protein